MDTRRKFLAVSAGVIGLAGCTSEGESDDTGGSKGGSSEDERTAEATSTSSSTALEDRYPNHYAIHEPTKLVVMNDVEASADSVAVRISGTVVNGSDSDYDYAQIEFGLYDDTGAKVGNALDNISGLTAGQRWRFEAVGTGDGAARWELEGMSAY